MPLKHVIVKSDQYTLKQAATMIVPETREKQGLSNYAFEVAFVDKIAKQSNRQIREQVFATDSNKNLIIDFICAAPGYFHKGYGVFLIHVAQVFGMEIVKQELKKEDEIPSTITTYLSCNNDLLNLYKVMGFEQVQYK